jgi:hypothetical protein
MERPNFEMDDVTDWRQNYVMGQAERLKCPKCGAYLILVGTFRRDGTA